MTLVLDASFVVAVLTDGGEVGSWAEGSLHGEQLAAPHLMPAEVTNVLRRLVGSGIVSADVAALACADLGRLPVTFFEFEPFADRVWELRDNVTAYDAWYIALAEYLEAPLGTLDERLMLAVGPRCDFLRTPESSGT